MNQNATIFLTIALTYIAIALIVAVIFHFVFKRDFIGSFWGGLAVALVGSALGGIIDWLLKDVILFLSNLNGAINIFPPLITAIILAWTFATLSESRRQ